MVQYQPRWVKGQESGDRQRECADRYEPIRADLAKYDRPFSVVDLGANAGYFAFRIAEDFPQATVIAIDDKAALRECAEANGRANVIVIPRRLDGAALAKLATCERFDAVLALNVLHHIGDWPVALEALHAMAHRLIVETPGPGDTGAAHPERHNGIRVALAGLGADDIARFPAHTTNGAERIMYVVAGDDRTEIDRQTLDAEDRGCPKKTRFHVERGYQAARFQDERGEDRDFLPGLNLWNFRLLGGCWPRDPAALVRAEVARLETEGRWMDDLRPWNFILSGGRAQAIDLGHKAWRAEPEPGGLETCLDILRAGRA